MIKIFKNENLQIDLPTFIDSRALICANSGGGKSYAVRKLLEESNQNVMSIILDVEGEFRTLRERYDFLLIGTEGDVDLSMKSAKLLPKKIMELEVSTIIDISDLKRNERIKYVKDFLESLMELPKRGGFWKPCLVILDEAHLLAGQQEKQDSCSAVIDLMTRGRKRGYCGVLCTQRISKLHKDAVAEANNIMIGRTGLDIDMKRAAEILGFTNKLDMLSLRDLEAGEFFVFGTSISRHVIKAKVAEVVTTHPKVGMDLRKEIIKPTEKIIGILSKIKDLPHEAEKKLKEINDYKKEIFELKKQIRSRPGPAIDEKALQRATEQGFNTCRKEMQKEISFLRKENDLLIKRDNKIAELLKVPMAPRPEYKPEKPAFVPPTPEIRIIPKQYIKEEMDHQAPIEIDLGICAKKIYSFLYHNEGAYTKSQIGAMTGYSQRSGGFNNALYQLNSRGLISRTNGIVQIDHLDASLAGNYDFSKKAILSKLGLCPRRIYEFLLNNPIQEFSKEEIAGQTEYSPTSGGFNNAIYNLNTLGLIQRNNNNIKLNPELLEI